MFVIDTALRYYYLFYTRLVPNLSAHIPAQISSIGKVQYRIDNPEVAIRLAESGPNPDTTL